MPNKVRTKDLSNEAVRLIAARFKVLSDPSRLKLLIALESGEQCVTALVNTLGIPQANASRHLQTLAEAGLVTRRKQGVTVYYAIADMAVFSLCEHVCGSVRKRLREQAKAADKLGL